MLLNHLKTVMHNIRIPKHIRHNFKTINPDKMNELREILREEYFKNIKYSIGVTSENYLATAEGKTDVENHTVNRLNVFRNTVVPWLDSLKKLSSSKILEIGCGTGCSTLALAEQGAIVTGIDIDEASIRVAKFRANLYGVDYTLLQENATRIDRFSKQSFDLVIFFASLEHMTIDERIEALKKAWDLLSAGSILVVIETPNRLWFRDEHASLLPFFHWLPDQLAFYYSSRSQRINFYRFSNDLGSQVPMTFHRLGRGVSYHEFEIAIGKNAKLKVIGDLDSFLAKRSINPLLKLKRKISKGNRYYKLIKSLNPFVHSSFFRQELNLAIIKE